MTGKGLVIKTCANTATVRIQKSSACGHDCGECKLCSNPMIELEILNPVGAREGDTVIIGQDTGKVLMWAFLVYILPIIGSMIFYFAGSLVFKNRICAVLLTAVWIVLWFITIRLYSRNNITMSFALEVVHEKN